MFARGAPVRQETHSLSPGGNVSLSSIYHQGLSHLTLKNIAPVDFWIPAAAWLKCVGVLLQCNVSGIEFVIKAHLQGGCSGGLKDCAGNHLVSFLDGDLYLVLL